MGPEALHIRGDLAFTHARTLHAAMGKLALEVEGLGFDAVDYGYMPRARAPDGRYHAPSIVAQNLPRRWLQGWTRFLRDDPLLYGTYPRNLPLEWQAIAHAPWLTPIQREAFRFIRELGISDGVTVPIHLPDDAFAFVTVTNRDSGSTWRSQKRDVLDRLFVLAHAFHAAHGGRVKVPPRPSRNAITAREKVVLAYAAAGLNAPETAARIHRSVETVRLQRKSAMKKLGAHTIAQAVARAMDAGVIAINPAG